MGRVCSNAANAGKECYINPLLVVTSGRQKLLAWQKVGFTAVFRSHCHLSEMVSPTHLEIIYSLVLENLGGEEVG